MSSSIAFLTSTLTPISMDCDTYSILYLSANSCTHLAPVLPGATITYLPLIDSSFLPLE